MIKVRINNSSKKITITGHAMYDDYGKDIVCAGVSTIVTTTVNAINIFGHDTIEVLEGNPLVITIKKEDEITTKLITNMIMMLEELSESYPKNIVIRKED